MLIYILWGIANIIMLIILIISGDTNIESRTEEEDKILKNRNGKNKTDLS